MARNPSRVIGIFPTPVLHVPALLNGVQVEALHDALMVEAGTINAKSSELVHLLHHLIEWFSAAS